MGGVGCPLCGSVVAEPLLEGHLRTEMAYARFRCLLCPTEFLHRPRAFAHFRGPFAEHANSEVRILDQSSEESDAELARLLRQARPRPPCTASCRACCKAQPPTPSGATVAQSTSQTIIRQGFEQPTAPFKVPTVAVAVSEAATPTLVANPMRETSRGKDSEPSPHAEPSQTLAPKIKPIESTVRVVEEGLDEHMLSQEEDDEDGESLRDEREEVEGSLKEEEDERAEDRGVEQSSEQGRRGRLVCLLCLASVVRGHLGDHVYGKHLEDPAYQCRLCSYAARRRDHLRVHQRKLHGVELSAETVAEAAVGAEVERLLAECFGPDRLLRQPRRKAPKLTCHACHAAVKLTAKLRHAANHLDEVLYSCRLCPFESRRADRAEGTRHVRQDHPDAADADALVSHEARWRPRLLHLVKELFPEQPKTPESALSAPNFSDR